MSIIKRKNEEEMPVMSSLLDNFFDSEWFHMPTIFKNRELPPVNIKDSPQHFMLELAVPGMKKEDFNISIENQMLIISTEQEKREETKEGEFTRKEFSYESFCRTFNLPENVNADKIKADYHEGILSLTLPKKVASRKKQVKQIKID